MGPFIIFLTLDDLLSFGSPQVPRSCDVGKKVEAMSSNPSASFLSAGAAGVYGKPPEHRPAQTIPTAPERHQLLHRAGLSAGQQLRSLTVS